MKKQLLHTLALILGLSLLLTPVKSRSAVAQSAPQQSHQGDIASPDQDSPAAKSLTPPPLRGPNVRYYGDPFSVLLEGAVEGLAREVLPIIDPSNPQGATYPHNFA